MSFDLLACAPKQNGQLKPAPDSGTSPTATPDPTSSARPLTTPTSATEAGIQPFQHVFVIVMENQSYGSMINNSHAPWLRSAVKTYGVATQYYAIGHPSQPNYIALTSGSTQGVTSDNTVTLNTPNLVDQLETHGKSWKAYMQSIFSNGNTDKLASTAGDYARKHNPFASYANIQNNPARLAKIVPFSQFTTDLHNNTVPDFSWISPDLCHDMHGHFSLNPFDPCNSIRGSDLVSQGDTFLSTTVNEIMHSSAWSGNLVIFITWDEGSDSDNSGCCGTNPGGGHVITLVIAHNVQGSRTSNVPYNHYSLLATIEQSWGLGCLGQTCDTIMIKPMSDLVN